MPFQLKHFTQEQVHDAIYPKEATDKNNRLIGTVRMGWYFGMHNPRHYLERMLQGGDTVAQAIYNEFRPWTTGKDGRLHLVNTFNIPIFASYERNSEIPLKTEDNVPPTRWNGRTKKVRHICLIAGNLTDPDHIQQLSDAIASDRALSKIHAEKSQFRETPEYDNTKVKHYVLYLTKPSALDGITQPEIILPEEKLNEYELIKSYVDAVTTIISSREIIEFNTEIAKEKHIAIYGEELKDI